MMYGSVVNSLCQESNSDLDLTFIIDDPELNHEIIIRALLNELKKVGRFICIQEPMLISSGVLLSFVDSMNQIEVDISINKVLEIKNSELIQAYAAYDIRFIKLALILKAWNKRKFPDKLARLNSFSIYLMTIAFFQSKGILPNLQGFALEEEKTRYQL